MATVAHHKPNDICLRLYYSQLVFYSDVNRVPQIQAPGDLIVGSF